MARAFAPLYGLASVESGQCGDLGTLRRLADAVAKRGGRYVATLPLLDETSVIELESWQTPLLDGSVNEVTVLGRDCVTNLDLAATFQNMANVQAQGRVVADRRSLPGLWNRSLCERVAARETGAVVGLNRRRV